MRGWQGRSPSHRACLKVTAPAAPYRACILPGLLQRYDAGTLFRTAFVPYNVPQCGGFVKGGCANLSGPWAPAERGELSVLLPLLPHLGAVAYGGLSAVAHNGLAEELLVLAQLVGLLALVGPVLTRPRVLVLCVLVAEL